MESASTEKEEKEATTTKPRVVQPDLQIYELDFLTKKTIYSRFACVDR